jgi:hypothetical protein
MVKNEYQEFECHDCKIKETCLNVYGSQKPPCSQRVIVKKGTICDRRGFHNRKSITAHNETVICCKDCGKEFDEM